MPVQYGCFICWRRKSIENHLGLGDKKIDEVCKDTVPHRDFAGQSDLFRFVLIMRLPTISMNVDGERIIEVDEPEYDAGSRIIPFSFSSGCHLVPHTGAQFFLHSG